MALTDTEFRALAALAELLRHRSGAPVGRPEGRPPSLAELHRRRGEVLGLAARHGARHVRVVGLRSPRHDGEGERPRSLGDARAGTRPARPRSPSERARGRARLPGGRLERSRPRAGARLGERRRTPSPASVHPPRRGRPARVRGEDRDRLEHILEAAERIADYAAPGKEAFLAEPMRQDAIIRNLAIIGEAAADSPRSSAPPMPRFRGRTSSRSATS
jgi:Protein of unknown function DUF86